MSIIKRLKRSPLLKPVEELYHKVINANCDKKRLPLVPELCVALNSIADSEARNILNNNILPPLNQNTSSSDYKNVDKELIGGMSVISSNCFAGRIMQDLGMEYNSPTLGLYFMYPDYIEFLKNLKFYLKEAKIEFVEHSKYPIGDARRAAWKHWYPIGLLDGKVEIHFLHYYSEEEAAEKWYRRAGRVNFDNLMVIGMQQNLCTENDIKEFDKLPFKNKVIFSCLPIDLKSNEFMPEFAGCENVGDPYRKGDLFYRHLINHLSSNK